MARRHSFGGEREPSDEWIFGCERAAKADTEPMGNVDPPLTPAGDDDMDWAPAFAGVTA
jgi:hypothetical protein